MDMIKKAPLSAPSFFNPAYRMRMHNNEYVWVEFGGLRGPRSGQAGGR